MAIRRNKQTRNYVEIPNATIQDSALSWEARGLLAFMLSKPEDFKIMPAYLVKCGNAGRDKVYKLLNELEIAGYLVKEQGRSDGKYGKSDYVVYDEKQKTIEYRDLEPDTENALSVNSPFPEMPETVKPDTANQDTNKNRDKKEQSSTTTTTTTRAREKIAISDFVDQVSEAMTGSPVPVWFVVEASGEIWEQYKFPKVSHAIKIILDDWKVLDRKNTG